MQLQAVHVRDPFVGRELAQLKPFLRRIDRIAIDAQITPRPAVVAGLLAPALSLGPPHGSLAHLAAISVRDAHLVQVHLGRLPRAGKEEAPPAAPFTEEPVDGSGIAGVVSELGQRIQRREQQKVLRGPVRAHVEVAGLVARRAVAAVELLLGPGRVGGRVVNDWFMGKREEDNVLDGAAVARAVEGAAGWSC